MKIILIIYLSLICNSSGFVIKGLILTLIPSVLTFLEPDTGNVIMYFVIYFSILLYNSNISRKKIICFLLLILFVSFIFIFFCRDYRFIRISSLVNNNSYQLSYGLIGVGISFIIGSNYNVNIPFYYTDFAFDYLTLRIGFIGILIFLIFNFSFDIYLLKSIKYYGSIYRNMIFSFLMLKLFNELIHILMNIGLFPITGIVLPFVSLGGSSLISMFWLISILLNNNMVDLVDRGS